MKASKRKLFYLYASAEASLADEFGCSDDVIEELKEQAELIGIKWEPELVNMHKDWIWENIP